MANRSYYEQALQNPTVQAFLKFISWSEGANYNTLVGGGSFSDYSMHPGNRGFYNASLNSTAAGAYQFVRGTWNSLASILGLSGFTPSNQDLAAVALLDQAGGLQPLLTQGNAGFNQALRAAGTEWAGVPGSSLAAAHGQSSKPLSAGLAKWAQLTGDTAAAWSAGLPGVSTVTDILGLGAAQDYVFGPHVQPSSERFAPYLKTPVVSPQQRVMIATVIILVILAFTWREF
jgi:lysozyme